MAGQVSEAKERTITEPRCPKCGGSGIGLKWSCDGCIFCIVCIRRDCGFRLESNDIQYLTDFAQFFPDYDSGERAGYQRGVGQRFKTIDIAISDLAELAEMLREKPESTGFDGSIALRLDQVAQTLRTVDPT